MHWFKNKLKNIYVLFVFLCLPFSITALEVSVRPSGHKKIPLLLATISESSCQEELNAMATIIKNDFEFRRQFDVTIRKMPAELTKSSINA